MPSRHSGTDRGMSAPVLSIVAAVARNGVIGRDNALPWRLPADLKHFKAITMGKPVIMGRKTWESIGRPLPGRRNIVVTRNPSFAAPGAELAGSLDAALALVDGCDEVCVIGGAQLYREALSRADKMYLTFVEADVHGDARFPDLSGGGWVEVSSESHPADAANPHPYRFALFERRVAISVS